jgi:hypothetical protein
MKDETYVQICFTGGAIVLFIICASQSCSGIIIVRALGYTPNPTKLFEPTQVQSTHHHDVRTSHDKLKMTDHDDERPSIHPMSRTMHDTHTHKHFYIIYILHNIQYKRNKRYSKCQVY